MSQTVIKLTELTGHSGAVYSLALNKTDDILYSAGSDRMLVSWNLNQYHSGSGTAIGMTHDAIFSLCFSEANRMLYAGCQDGTLYVIPVDKPNDIRRISLDKGSVFCIREDMETDTLLVSTSKGYLILLHLPDLRIRASFQLDTAKIRCFYMTSDSKLLYTGHQDGSIRAFTYPEMSVIQSIPISSSAVNCMNQYGDTLIIGSRDAHIRVLSLDSNEIKNSVPAHNYAVYNLTILGNSHILASASRDKTIKLWNPETMQIYCRIDASAGGHRNSVNSLIWHEQKSTLISCSDDARIILWEIKSMYDDSFKKSKTYHQ
jgi:WD40 repeat protein